MSGSSKNLGTKNLGLIKAIYVGVNPPLNTKILWYNDSTLPYLTGPPKVHYYYDVILADWYPLIGTSGSGTFNYIAYSSTCDGTGDFSLVFDNAIHCYWALIVSTTSIPVISLLPALFVNKWTRFCKCDASGNLGNFTYIMYADDCDGTGFSPDLQYEIPCSDCIFADYYNKLRGNNSFLLSQTLDSLIIDLVNVTPGQSISIDVKLPGSIPLTDLVDYDFEIITLPTYSGQLKLNLGVSLSEVTLNSPTTGTKFVVQNQGSILNITVPGGQPPINSQIQIKIGTLACLAKQESGSCYCNKKFFGIITSMVEIDTLTPAMFNNHWMSTGSCDCSDNFDAEGAFIIVENQIVNINNNFNTYVSSNDAAILALQDAVVELMNSSLKKYYQVVNLVADTPLTITHNFNLSPSRLKNIIIEARDQFGNTVIIKADNHNANQVDLTSLIDLSNIEIKII